MYMASSMDKRAFCELVKPIVKREPDKRKNYQKFVRVWESYTYNIFRIFEVTDIRISSGKYVVKDTGRVRTCESGEWWVIPLVDREDIIIRK